MSQWIANASDEEIARRYTQALLEAVDPGSNWSRRYDLAREAQELAREMEVRRFTRSPMSSFDALNAAEADAKHQRDKLPRCAFKDEHAWLVYQHHHARTEQAIEAARAADHRALAEAYSRAKERASLGKR